MAGNITVTLVTDDQKAKQQVNQFFYNLEKNTQRSASRMGRLNQQVTKLGKDLKSYAMGAGIFGGLAAGAKTATKWVQKMNQELERSSQLSQQTAGTYSQLAQVSTPQTPFSELKQSADQIREKWGVQKSKAANFTFATKSVGQYENRDYWSKLLPWTDQTGNIVKKVSGLQTSFGAQEAGNVKQVLNKGLKASELSETTPSKLFPYASRAAKFTEPIGSSDEETLAALAATAEQSGIEEATTGIRGFASKLGEKGATGGLLENFRRIRKKDLNQKELNDLLKSQEAVAGYQAIEKAYDEILSAKSKIATAGERAGTQQSPLNKKLTQLLSDKDVIADIYKRRKEQSEKISLREEYGSEQTTRGGKFSEIKEKIRDETGMGGGVAYEVPLRVAKYLEGAMGKTAGTFQSKILESAKKERYKVKEDGTAETPTPQLGPGVIKNWMDFFTSEENNMQGELQELRKSLTENNKIMQENNEVQREKLTGETVPDEQTGAEPVNN